MDAGSRFKSYLWKGCITEQQVTVTNLGFYSV